MPQPRDKVNLDLNFVKEKFSRIPWDAILPLLNHGFIGEVHKRINELEKVQLIQQFGIDLCDCSCDYQLLNQINSDTNCRQKCNIRMLVEKLENILKKYMY